MAWKKLQEEAVTAAWQVTGAEVSVSSIVGLGVLWVYCGQSEAKLKVDVQAPPVLV